MGNINVENSNANKGTKSIIVLTTYPYPVPKDMPKEIVEEDLDSVHFCPKCKSLLTRDHTYVHANATTLFKIYGMSCNQCKTLYVNSNKKVPDYLSRCYSYIKAKKERKIKNVLEKMCKEYEGSIASFFIAPCDESKEDSPNREFIVITSNRNVCTSDKRYIFYTSEFARNILAILNQDSDRKLVKDGIEYKILNSYYCELESRYIPWPFWTVGKGGGLKKDNDEKFVDLLIYSAKTKRYEILRATENSNGKCYSDISLYKNFVKRYGLTDLKAQPVTRQDENYNINDFLSLNEKSVLMECGYNVKSNNRMSPNERQTLLSDIIALKILDKESIVKHLESCISLHKSEKYDDARDKWSDDLDYILSFDNSEGADKFYFLRQI